MASQSKQTVPVRTGYAQGTQSRRADSDPNLDLDYQRWRDQQLECHDRAYRAWRTERVTQYDEQYKKWADSRRDKFNEEFSSWQKSQAAAGKTKSAAKKRTH